MSQFKPDEAICEDANAVTGYPQALLRRKPGLSNEEFRAAWLEHSRAGMPWGLDCGVTHFVHIVDPVVANPAAMPEGVDINDIDGVAEFRAPSEQDAGGSDADKAARRAYLEQIVGPSESRYCAGPIREIAIWVPPRTITGTRVEFMVDGELGKDATGLDQEKKAYEDWKTEYLAQHGEL